MITNIGIILTLIVLLAFMACVIRWQFLELDMQRWITRIWEVRRVYNQNGKEVWWEANGFFNSVWWSICVLFGQEDDRLLEELDGPGCDVAFKHLGYRHTDYGISEEFAFLRVCRFRYAIGQDGTL